MKKNLYIIVVSLFLSFVFFLSLEYVISLKADRGALQVTAAPESKVYLNNSYLGKTPICKCDASTLIPVGDYMLRIVPEDQGLEDFQEQITISKAVLTVVDRKFASNMLSEGSVISLSPLPDSNSTSLLVVSIPEKADVFLDNNKIGDTPLLYNNPTVSDHEITIQKDGYNPKSIPIRTPGGYKLTLQIYLSSNQNLTINNQASNVSNISPSPFPTSTVTGQILNTPTGYLRVRQTPSANSAFINEVYPGQTYKVMNRQTGWVEILLNNNTVGWVSDQYVQIQ